VITKLKSSHLNIPSNSTMSTVLHTVYSMTSWDGVLSKKLSSNYVVYG